MMRTCTIGGSGVGRGLLEEAEVRVQSPMHMGEHSSFSHRVNGLCIIMLGDV